MTDEELQAYEADLEAVLEYLDAPPAPGSPEDQEFVRLLQRVEQAESAFTAEPGNPFEGEPTTLADTVRKRLSALRAATTPAEKPRFVEGGEEGIGPTLGMDVRGS